jgi:pimeloyl-ACP methyl ester carboxylesterase
VDVCCDAAETLNLPLPSGTLRAHRFGPAGAPLVVCVHGLSANSRSFDFLGESLASKDRAVVAIDLRGRGWSDVTRAGTYGWANHAKDVLDAADALGAERFDFVGHSMGAYVGMELARQAAHRVGRIVLIDAVGLPEAAAMPPILAAVQRLGAVHADADAYVAAVRRLGTVEPWSKYWDQHYRYDLVPARGGVSPRTHAGAVLEDIAYASTQQPYRLWGSLAMPSLLVRAARPLGTSTGFIVSAADRDRFVAQVRGARAVEVDANHYGVITHADTAAHVRSFLS